MQPWSRRGDANPWRALASRGKNGELHAAIRTIPTVLSRAQCQFYGGDSAALQKGILKNVHIVEPVLIVDLSKSLQHRSGTGIFPTYIVSLPVQKRSVVL